MYKFIISISVIIGFASCIELYDPEVGEYLSTLVVEGFVSDRIGASEIKLSTSFAYDENSGNAVSGAKITIEDDNGGQFEFSELEAGIYKSNDSAFKGNAGNSYRLLIALLDGQSYESNWELLKPSPQITSVEYEIVEQLQNEPGSESLLVANFFVNTEDPSESTKYYKWTWEETFEFALTSPSRIRVAGSGGDEVIRVPFDDFEGNSCYKTVLSNQIYIATTENLLENKITRMPIHSFGNTSPRLAFQYSILVKQFAISKENYLFLKKIEEINEGRGDLFDPIPNEIFGNIKSSGDQSSPVLGFFGVGGISEQRIIVYRDDIPREFAPIRGPHCVSDTIPLNFTLLSNSIANGRKVLYEYHSIIGVGNIGYILTDAPCNVCSASESTNVKPDFW
ncbi:MAG: hypothetical protein ACI9FN_003085 [Saprospiraceae bacterium]|jgi:hypothetical protein